MVPLWQVEVVEALEYLEMRHRHLVLSHVLDINRCLYRHLLLLLLGSTLGQILMAPLLGVGMIPLVEVGIDHQCRLLRVQRMSRRSLGGDGAEEVSVGKVMEVPAVVVVMVVVVTVDQRMLHQHLLERILEFLHLPRIKKERKDLVRGRF